MSQKFDKFVKNSEKSENVGNLSKCSFFQFPPFCDKSKIISPIENIFFAFCWARFQHVTAP